MPRIDLTNKPIAVTGASSGIGAAAALACARAGMPVALAARRTRRLDELCRRINDEGGRAVAMPCDVTSQDQCNAMIARTIDEFGSVYAVFANAGIGARQNLLDTPESTLREIFEINFFGTVHTIRAAADPMIRAGAGHILICTSCLSALPSPGYSAYSATKSAQHHIGRALGVELSATGVRVTTVHPVRTETEFFDAMLARNDAADVPRGTPARGQSADHVARAIVRVLSRPRPELWLSCPAEVGFKLASLLPRLTDRLVWGRGGR